MAPIRISIALMVPKSVAWLNDQCSTTSLVNLALLKALTTFAASIPTLWPLLRSRRANVRRHSQGPSLRTHVLIHKANKPSDLQGCLAPGVDFGFVGNEWAVVNSSHAFKVLMAELNGKPAKLTIVKD